MEGRKVSGNIQRNISLLEVGFGNKGFHNQQTFQLMRNNENLKYMRYCVYYRLILRKLIAVNKLLITY